MDPIPFYCLLTYVLVTAFAVLQTRGKIFTENPWAFIAFLVLAPIMVLGKMKRAHTLTYTVFTEIVIATWTVVIASFKAKSISPRLNEGYIYAYTLFHWYLLYDTTAEVGLNFWTSLIGIISVYPTWVIVRTAFQHRKLRYDEKVILYYWFLFAVLFTYFDQVAMHVITPILEYDEITSFNTFNVFLAAGQIYFIATCFALLFLGVPFFHLDKSSEAFKVRWERAVRECRQLRQEKLVNYIEYQISPIQLIAITLLSFGLFYYDILYTFKLGLIFIYTLLLPVVFFYLRYTPKENIVKRTRF